MNRSDLQCSVAGSAKPSDATAAPLSIDITTDGFVWKNGQRIGWVDARGPAFYWVEQLVFDGESAPTPKPGADGWEVSREHMKRDVDAFVRSPAEMLEAAKPKIEKSADGFVWRSGQRIGWVNAAGTVFHPMSEIEIIGETARPKVGAEGYAIARGDLESAIRRAELLKAQQNRQ